LTYSSFLSPYAYWLLCSTLIINMLNESCLRCGVGMSHMICFRANISSLASSILSVALSMSYIMTTNFSRLLWSSLPSTGGYFLKTVDASGHTFYVCHALFSPLSWNADTTSQPVNRPVYVKHNIFSCKYNCMLELLGLPLVLHILQTFSISLKAMHLLTPIRPKCWS
jgi:hypothetical protein